MPEAWLSHGLSYGYLWGISLPVLRLSHGCLMASLMAISFSRGCSTKLFISQREVLLIHSVFIAVQDTIQLPRGPLILQGI